MGKFIEKTLSNGLKVYFYHEKEVKSIDVTLLAKSGKAYEKPSEFGISHFVEHLMFAGTEKYPEKFQTMDTIWQLGGINNGVTSLVMTHYPVKVKEEDFEIALDIIYQETQKALFKNESVKEEKDIITEEIRRGQDQPKPYLNYEILTKAIYNFESLQGRTIGTEETVKKIKQKELIKEYQNTYNANNTQILVVSRIDPDKLLPKIENVFGKVPNGEERALNLNKTEVKERLLFADRPLKQINIGLGFQIPGFLEEDSMGFYFLSQILSYRLHDRVRLEKQLAYDTNVGAEVLPFAGRVNGVIPVNKEKVIEALKTILEVFEEVKKEIEEKAFVKAKNTIITAQLFKQENAARYAFSIISKTLYTGEIETPEERIEMAEIITKEDIIKLANEYLNPEHLGWAFLGDIDEKTEKEIRKLLS